ncbi:MAG: GIY-YIG nuclease family protein [candidate division WOR-3 bacterium]|nr:MAG: GIY-YIG nuclease family protein [candidate division WOR-3 bacterium]
MKYCVYIIESLKDRSTYTGCTSDLARRLESHNKGTTHSTRHSKPFRLVWHATFNDRKKAYRFEKYLKSGSGRAFMKKRLI